MFSQRASESFESSDRPSIRAALLRSLADGVAHSTNALAASAHCTAGEARSGIADLRELGAEIVSIPGKGYRLDYAAALLDAEVLRPLLKGTLPALDLVLLDEVDSTNARLLREAASGAAVRSGRVCTAEIQTAGRGRRGRTWYTVPGASIAFSMLWCFEQRLDFLAGLSLAAGVAVARVLHGLGAHEVRLKWPNDVLHHQLKLAGILVETQGGASGPSIAVIGIGMNLLLPPTVRGRIDQAVTDLASTLKVVPERNLLLSMLMRELASVLHEFARGGFAALRDEWAALHAYQGRPVRLQGAGSENINGQVVGVAADGALLVDTDAGEQRFYSGEISLRAA
jgi:BirA family biotin operon repressor/biotin-[acetyl-CoA-carboxylase] ligase